MRSERTGDRRGAAGADGTTGAALGPGAGLVAGLGAPLKAGSLCAFCVAVCALCVLAACNALPTGLSGKPVGAYDRPYPAELSQTETVDIQVLRGPETKISMTNTTARSFGPSTVWINARFSRPIPGLASGQTVTLDLYDFRDQFGERFRAGGFFATKPPDKIMHTQLETIVDDETRMIGLITVDQDDIR